MIGAILTTIITLVLLANQTESEESLQKRSVIYEEKLRIFNEFLRTLGESIKDGKLSKEELKVLIYSYALVKMNLSQENALRLEVLLGQIDEEFFYVDENLVPNYHRHIELFTGICDVFKCELYGTEVAESAAPQFLNFYAISYHPRIKTIVVKEFDKMLFHIRQFQRVIWIGTENTVSFELKEDLIASFDRSYRAVEEVVSQSGVQSINKVFDLGYFRINDKQYLKCPHIAYRIEGKNVLEVWIERLNRVVVYLKAEDKTKGEQKVIRRFQIEVEDDITKLLSDVAVHLKTVGGV